MPESERHMQRAMDNVNGIPLYGHNSTLKVGEPLRRKKGLNPMSPKRRKQAKARRELVAKVLSERPWCEAKMDGCTFRSEECHEVLSRARGGDFLNEDEILALCGSCHRRVTREPMLAHSLGLLRHSWEGPSPKRGPIAEPEAS